MLNLGEMQDRDPSVERLLEGVAFLTAHIRKRIDESEVAVSEQLLQQYCPEQLEPAPSMTILQFAGMEPLRHPVRVPAGAEVRSEALARSGASCRFRTTEAIDLQTLELDTVWTRDRQADGVSVGLRFLHTGERPLHQLSPGPVRLFLHAAPTLVLAFYHALVSHEARIWVRFGEHESADWQALPSARIRSLGLDDSPGATGRSRPAYIPFGLLRNYFHFRNQFHFVELRGLDTVSWPAECESFEVRIDAGVSLPSEYRLSRENVRLNCVSATNLFLMDAAPVLVDHRRTEYPVNAEQAVIHSIESVESRELKGGQVHHFLPAWDSLGCGRNRRRFRFMRRDLGGEFPTVFLSLSGGVHRQAEVLSCSVMASNGHLPRRHLHIGQIREPGKGVPAGLQVTNLSRPSRCRTAPDDPSYRQRLHAVMALGLTAIADRVVLQQLLLSLNWNGTEEDRLRIASIVHTRVRPMNRISRGILHRGQRIDLVLDEACFSNGGDLYLFGTIIHRFLSAVAPLGDLVEMRVRTRPTGKEYAWMPLSGMQPAM